MRKYYYGLSILALSTSIIAGGPDQFGPDYTLSGVYLGAQLGADLGNFKLNSTSTTTINANLTSFAGHETAQNVIGGINLGFGHQSDNFYIGLFTEANYYHLSTRARDDINFTGPDPDIELPNHFNISLESSFGLGIKPGVMLSPNDLLYLKAAVMWSNAKFTTVYDPFDATRALPRDAINNTQEKYLTGGKIGLGLETHLKQHLAFFLEYDYNYFGKISKSVTKRVSAGDERYQSTNVTLSTSQFLAGINYYFRPGSTFYKTVANITPKNFSGFYAGLFGGADWLFINGSHYILNTGNPPINSTLNHQSGNWTGLGGAEIGFGLSDDPIYLGIVLHGEYNRHQFAEEKFEGRFTGTTSLDIDSTVTQQQYGGFDAKLGFFIQPSTLLYTKIGGQWNKFSLTNFSNRLDINTYYIAASRKKLGTEFGLGIEHMLNSFVTLYIEDIYSTYGSLNIHNGPTATSNPQTSTIWKLPRTNKLVFGINCYV